MNDTILQKRSDSIPTAQQSAKRNALNPADPVPTDTADWLWPEADTFTDDSNGQRIIPTCSELGSERVRLLKIRPGPQDGVVERVTKICYLSKAGEYTALSYTWGCPVERNLIAVDQQPRLVTTNLWRFLRQARELPKRFSGWLWIDALSICQSDPWEKLEQVKVISKIFRAAELTVVWLGPAYGDSDGAMKALASQLRSTNSERRRRALWAPPLGPAFLDICERPYWRRLWVVQELKAACKTDIMCGSRCVALTCLEQLILDDKIDERVDYKVERLRQSPAGKMVGLIKVPLDTSLRAVLIATEHLCCADPRDKLYAILNVAVSGHREIEADYTSSLRALLERVLVGMSELRRRESWADVDKECRLLERLFGLQHESLWFTGRLHVMSGGRIIDVG